MMGAPRLRVLVVEDNPADARMVRELLGDTDFDVTHVDRLSAASAEPDAADVVLMDLSLPDAGQDETVQWMTDRARRVPPIIVLSGRRDAELARTLVRAGVEDYLEKNDLHAELLRRTVRHASERAAWRADLERARERELRAKDELLSHVSHELRTPLNAVYQFATLLHDDVVGPLTPEQGDCVAVILRNISQLRRMIGDLLEGTRIDAGTIRVDLAPIALPPLLDDVARSIAPLAADRAIRFTTAVAPDLPTVLADDGRVRQVVANLLDNALKFTPEGGRVLLSAEPGSEDTVVVRVIDTGCGIPPTEHDRIFERLYQVDDGNEATRKGLGIGLHLCRDFVARMGGALWVESVPGQGSRFGFTLRTVQWSEL